MTKFLTYARNRTTMRFMGVLILSHFCPRCDKFCHNSLIHQSKCHISYRNGSFVMTNIHGLHLRMTYLMSMTYKLNVPKIRIHEFSKLGLAPNPPNPRKLQTGFYQIHNLWLWFPSRKFVYTNFQNWGYAPNPFNLRKLQTGIGKNIITHIVHDS